MASDRHSAVEQGPEAVPSFSAIHSVDSRRLLEAIDAAAAEQDRPELLVQATSRGGNQAWSDSGPSDGHRSELRRALSCRAMCRAVTIPPLFEHPEDARPYFAQLRDLRATLLNEGLDNALLQELSMGMSHDFEIAVQEGATIVRLGTAIFGTRHV